MDDIKNEYDMISNEINKIRKITIDIKEYYTNKLKKVKSNEEKAILIQEFNKKLLSFKTNEDIKERYILLKKRLKYLEGELYGNSSKDSVLNDLLNRYKNSNSNTNTNTDTEGLIDVVGKIMNKVDNSSLKSYDNIFIKNHTTSESSQDIYQIELTKENRENIIDFYNYLCKLKKDLEN